MNSSTPSWRSSIGEKSWYFSMVPKYLRLLHIHMNSLAFQSQKYVVSYFFMFGILNPFEAPNETFKAAAHLVVTGHRRMFPDVKIILAHLGGTTPFLASRVAVLSNHMGCPLSPEKILDAFRSFNYVTALGSYNPS